MNPQIRRLFFVLVLLFTALVGIASYWLWKAPDLEARQGNPNLIVRQLTIKRGLIYAANGRPPCEAVVPLVRPESDRARLQARQPGAWSTLHVAGSAAEPRDRRALHPGLHLQARDRHGGARHGPVPAVEPIRRPRLLRRV